LTKVTSKRTAAGQFDRETNRVLEDDILAQSAIEYATNKQFDRGIKTANDIETRSRKDCTLVKIAGKCAEAGEFNLGLKAFNKIEDEYVKTEALYLMAEIYTANEQFDRALEIAETIEEADSKARVLAEITEAETACKTNRYEEKGKREYVETIIEKLKAASRTGD
jgi:lipopolysaccharide biosynthesis regulator YciM